MTTSIVGKIQINKALRPPKLLTAMPETVREMYCGRILGIADTIKVRTMPDLTQYEGLGGSFEAIPAPPVGDQEDMPTVQSGVLYLPAGIYETVADVVRTPRALTDDAGKPVLDKTGNPIQVKADKTGEPLWDYHKTQFAFDVFVFRANNPQGYSWRFSPVLEPAANDPLSALRNETSGVKALPAPATAAENHDKKGGKKAA